MTVSWDVTDMQLALFCWASSVEWGLVAYNPRGESKTDLSGDMVTVTIIKPWYSTTLTFHPWKSEQKFPIVRVFQGTATLDIQLLNIPLLILVNKRCFMWVRQHFQTTGHQRILTSPFFEFAVCYIALYTCNQQSHSCWSNDDMSFAINSW